MASGVYDATRGHRCSGGGADIALEEAGAGARAVRGAELDLGSQTGVLLQHTMWSVSGAASAGRRLRPSDVRAYLVVEVPRDDAGDPDVGAVLDQHRLVLRQALSARAHEGVVAATDEFLDAHRMSIHRAVSGLRDECSHR